MSKITRIALALVISLVVVAGVYFSVQALSANARQSSLGMYVLNGALVNSFKNQATEQETSKPQLEVYPDSSGEGQRDCDHESDNSSDL